MRTMRKAMVVTVAVLAGMLAPASGALAGGGGGCHGDGSTDAHGTAVDLAEACFSPVVLRTQPGSEVTWTNRDGFEHVVVGTGWGDHEVLTAGEAVTYRFAGPGVFAYSCYLHPGMNGVVIVGGGEASAGNGGGATVSAVGLPGSTSSDGDGSGTTSTEPGSAGSAAGADKDVAASEEEAPAAGSASRSVAPDDGSIRAWRIAALVAVALLALTAAVAVGLRGEVRRLRLEASPR